MCRLTDPRRPQIIGSGLFGHGLISTLCLATKSPSWRYPITMPQFHYKLSDSSIVADLGIHDLPDVTAAQIEAIKLARSVRETMPEFVGRNCVVLVTTQERQAICRIPIDRAN